MKPQRDLSPGIKPGTIFLLGNSVNQIKILINKGGKKLPVYIYFKVLFSQMWGHDSSLFMTLTSQRGRTLQFKWY